MKDRRRSRSKAEDAVEKQRVEVRLAAAAELKRWMTAMAPVLTVAITPRLRARRHSHDDTAAISSRSTADVRAGSNIIRARRAFGTVSTHCRTGTEGTTLSTRFAAKSAMRRPMQLGQKRRRLHETRPAATNRSRCTSRARSHGPGSRSAGMPRPPPLRTQAKRAAPPTSRGRRRRSTNLAAPPRTEPCLRVGGACRSLPRPWPTRPRGRRVVAPRIIDADQPLVSVAATGVMTGSPIRVPDHQTVDEKQSPAENES